MHTLSTSFPVCQQQLSVNKKQIAAVILHLLTKPWHPNTHNFDIPAVRKSDLLSLGSVNVSRCVSTFSFVLATFLSEVCLGMFGAICVYNCIQVHVEIVTCIFNSSCLNFISLFYLG